VSEELRAARAQIVADDSLRGAAFGRALASLLDRTLVAACTKVELPGRWALLALGSYGTAELCPASDVDVMLLQEAGRAARRGRTRDEVAQAVQQLFYPLWDAGFVLGHATRTLRDAVALADADVDALTALLTPRVVAGDLDLAVELEHRVRDLATRRRDRILDGLLQAASRRREHPGSIAEMLEPNLKEGGGGLRELQSLGWAGWALGAPGGVETLVVRGYLRPGDVDLLAEARAHLLDLRVALHRTTGARSDVMTLQDQDALAVRVGASDADALVRSLAATARSVEWLADDVWRRIESTRRGPLGRIASRDRVIARGVVLRDGEVVLTEDVRVDAAAVVRVAASAATHHVRISRATLDQLAALTTSPPMWTDDMRADLVELLRAGRAAIPVVEALDHAGVLATLIPEWQLVRAQPQRNAYHRFTVDRHLLEAVAECAAILTADDFDGEVARRARVDLLLLAALLHDIGKGAPGDHSEVGAERAVTIARRIGLDDHGVDVLDWLIHNHLLLADTATRRDLADEATIVRFGRAVRDTERLDLLYVLTVGDSRATGPAAWSTAKAALCRQLFTETDALLERGVVGRGLDSQRRAALERHRALLDSALRDAAELAVEWRTGEDGLLECIVVAPDRTGLLATVSGVLALTGFDVRAAAVYGDAETGMALEVYRGLDQYERLDDEGRAEFARRVAAALAGDDAWRAQLAERRSRYARADAPVAVNVDLAASSSATVVEVRTADDVGLFATVAGVFAVRGLDVSFAQAATLVGEVLDVFYVRDAHGAKVTEPSLLQELRDALVASVSPGAEAPAPT
jgi:[protein-PII] uridylyltransferase